MTLRLAALAMIAAATLSCGEGERPATPSSPSAPTPTLPAFVLTPLATSLTALAPSAPGTRAAYALAAEVSFRETAGAAGRIVTVTATVSDGQGALAPPAQLSVEVDVPANGTVRHELRATFEAERTATEVTLRLAGRGRDTAGTGIDLAPVEVPVRVAAPLPPADLPVTFTGAGDIAQCGSPGAEATARLLDAIPGVVFTLGDNVYPYATPANFRNCYDPSWGRHRARTRPVAGNHDWYDYSWWAYFEYFGAAAGPSGLGYYSYDLGGWHILALNSNLHGNAGSPQYEWVRQDLASTRASCILAYWHHPRFSSGPGGPDKTMRDVWVLLQQAGAELVLCGHDHIYERFAPQDADGRLDVARGLRQFIVGTGGYELYALGNPAANSEVRENRTWGVLKLSLHGAGYDWEFVPVAGGSFRDSGSGTCSP